jgi:serine/threonine-protein kinase RsbW
VTGGVPRPETGAAGRDAPVAESAEDLYENAPCGYLSTDPDGTIVRVNATFLSWTGFGREELVGRRFQDLLTAGGRIYHETHYAPLLRMQDAVREIALDIVCADGRLLPVLINSTLRRDADGQPQLIRTTVFNATDRRRYERELLTARERERAARARVERLQRITSDLAADLGPEGVAEIVVAHLVDGGLVDEVIIDAPRAAEGAAGGPVFSEDGSAGVLPLHIGGRASGVLRVAARADRPLDDDLRTLLVAVAAQCGGAMERARLRAETAEAAERWARLATASRLLAEVQGAAARARRLVDLVVPEFADRASVEVIDGGERVLLAGTPPPPGVDAAADRRRIELPLRTRGESLGTLTLGRGPAREPFDDHDVAFLADVAERAGLALEIALLLEQQRGIAHALQMSLLAGPLPEDARLRLAGIYRPGVAALEVGGDWYDAFRLGPDRLGLVVGDVVGRGLTAATSMGQLRSAIHALALTGLGPAALLEALDGFAHQLPGARWATVVYGEVDLARGRFRFACAGHPPPLIIDPGAEPRFAWEGRSAPLAPYSRRVARTDWETELRPGGRILLYTDGAVEVSGEPIDAGLARLARTVGLQRDAPVAEALGAVADAMLAGRTSRDDVCMLFAEMTGD